MSKKSVSRKASEMICILLFSLALLSMFALAQEPTDERPVVREGVGGFHFPHDDGSHTTISRPSRLSSYYLYSSDGPVQLVGEASGAPFVFHAGPQYCGWIGVPGLGWYGCGLHPYLPPLIAAGSATVESPSDETTAETIRLTEGMGQQEVLETVGSPKRKILLGLKEVWEYARFSLLFESAALKEIR